MQQEINKSVFERNVFKKGFHFEKSIEQKESIFSKKFSSTFFFLEGSL